MFPAPLPALFAPCPAPLLLRNARSTPRPCPPTCMRPATPCPLPLPQVEANIPRKRGAAAAGYDKAMESFYDKVRFLCVVCWTSSLM